MTPLTDTELSELERLDKARTQGEWEADRIDSEDGRGRCLSYAIRTDAGIVADAINADSAEMHEEYDEDGGHRWDEVARKNFAFIAACANALPRLIAEVRAWRADRQDFGND